MEQTESADTLDGSGAPTAKTSALVVGRIGRYPILRKLGEGGMGVVYAAYDDLLDRKLAIKLLRPRSREGQQRVRLLREAQGLARLSHQNVVQIYEIGEHGEAVYMAMEFVAGRTLRAWLEQQPRSRAQILEVFAAAGRGLAAAHAARLIHRDFKPDNVMVADDGGVKVMDFGLVRAEGASEAEPEEPTHGDAPPALTQLEVTSGSQSSLGVDLTKTGSIMGTPAYMAPEQHFGRPTDARTDQFSFCVALWEALHGVRPFPGESIAALAFNVTQGKLAEPPREADVPGWLRKVIERGLAREPADRWPSMEALLDALGRDPARRRRTLLSVVAVGTLALGAWGWQQADRERRAAAEERARDATIAACEEAGRTIDEVWSPAVQEQIGQAIGRSELGFADEAWVRTRTIVDRYASNWAEARTQVCLQSELEGELDPSTVALALACLDERKASLASFASLLAEGDDARIHRAVWSAAELPLLSDCTEPPKLAQMQPLPDDPRLRARVEALRERLARIHALDTMGEYELGSREAAAALAEAEELGWAPLIAAAQQALGRLASDSGDYPAARAAYEQAMWVAAQSGDDARVLEAAISLVYAVGVGLDDPEDGLRVAKLAEILLARLDGAGGPLEASLRNNIGAIHERRGQLDEALVEFERALTIYQATLPAAHPSISIALNNLGTIHARRGRLEQALDYFQQTLAIRESSLPPGHPRLAAAHENLGNLHAAQGSFDLAIAALGRALSIYEANLPPDHLDIANSSINLGAVHFEREDFAAAEPLFRRGLEIREAALPPDSRLLGAAHNNLGLALDKLGRHEQAIDHLGRALAIYEAALEPDDPRLAALLFDYARSLLATGAAAKAIPPLERALAIYEADEDQAEDQAEALTETRELLAEAIKAAPGARRAARR
ncbi:MAG: serine/threonine-protein kinase [Enhygromyxa sp.]